MTNSIWQATIQNDAGDVIPGAEITVVDENTGLNATIYSSRGGAALANPFFADSNGFAQFYAASGTYRVTAENTGTGETQTWRYIDLGDAASRDVGTATGQIPDADDLGVVGNTNYHSGNMNADSFGGNIDSKISGKAISATQALVEIKSTNRVEPTSISVTGNFNVLNADLSLNTSSIIPTLTTASGVGSVVVLLSGLSGLLAGDVVWLTCNNTGSNIEIN